MKKTITLLTILFVLTSSTSYSQFTTLLNFTGTANGSSPSGSLISDGIFLYGMTEFGGKNNLGTIFKIKPDGTGYQKLLDFDGAAKGANPKGSLYFDGTFLYGMTSAGGVNNVSSVTAGGGTIFKIKPDGTSYLKLLDCTRQTGFNPEGSLISDGTFLYGVTKRGGGVSSPAVQGTVFKVKPNGTNFTVLGVFPGDNSGGPIGSLLFDGTSLYGVAYGQSGSFQAGGFIFKINPDGTNFIILKTFEPNSSAIEGKNPVGNLISDGTFLYGMTQSGGTNTGGTIFKIQSDGTNFQVIRNFGFNGSGVSLLGNSPNGSLFYDGSTYLYGMNGGPSVLFKIKRDGTSFQKLSNHNGQIQGNCLISDGTFLYGMDSRSVFKYQYCNISAPTVSNNGPVCTGNTLSLTASTVTGATYSWTGPNGFTSTEQNPIVSTNATTAMGGTYSCVAQKDGCSSQAGTTNVVINQATASNNGPVCEGNTLSLTASVIPGATYFWSGPNGFTSTEQNPTVSLSATSEMAGVYSVFSVANGCTSATPGTTTVVINPVPNAPTASNNGPVCTGNTLSLTASTVTGATYAWSGPNGFTSTQQNPTISTSATAIMGGVYSVIATVNGCSSIAGVTTAEINRITASNNGPVCVANPLSLSATTITGASYSWTGPNGFTSAEQNPIVSTNATAAMAGVYSVTSFVNGCTSPSSATIVSINPAIATPTVTSPVTYCQNATATKLTATGSNLLWYSAQTGGTGSSTAPTPSTTVAETTTYYVSQTINCESPRVSISVIVNSVPVNAGTVSGTSTVCKGQNAVTYTVPSIAGATSYVWTLPTGATGASTSNSITVNYGNSAVSGNITVKGNNSCGDGTSSSLAITVNSLPANAGTISGSATVCKGQNAVTYAVPVISNATSYVWTLPSGATGTSTTNSITVNYSNSAVSGNITVKGNNSCGDGVASSLSIIVNSIPVSAGTISGSSSVCQGQNAVNYTVPLISGASSYVWSLPNGVTGTSSTNSITINFSTSAVSAGIEVYGQNSCGNGNSSIIAVSVNSIPVSASAISGTTTVCKGQNAVTYTVPSIAGATSYVWTLPTGATGASTSNSITVNYGNSAVSGNITVKGNNSCGDGTSSSLAITVNALPSNAGTISGSATVCKGQNAVTYAVPVISNATSYVWTLPSGATGTSTTNSITVNYSNSAVSGNITVKGNNLCGDGVASSFSIIVNSIPVSAGTISGSSSVCQGQNAVNYTVPLISGASSYVWSLPNGVTGTSSTNSITINFSTSAVSAGIEVYGQNSCGNGNSSIIAVSVNSIPVSASAISGTTTVCKGQNAVTYTVPSIAGATSYVWTLPTGATGASTSNSITVNYGNSAVSGNITVKGNNSCGDGTSSSLAITVNALPSNAGTISGSATVCQGQASVFYAVPSIANTTSYVWTLPSGATGTSTSNSITVNYGNSAVSGNISVKGKNSCGNGVFSTLAVSVNNTLPPTGNILQNFTEGQTLSNIEITGTNLIWYGNLPDATNQINSIGNTTLLINDTTYYVTQTNNDCESAPFAITVTVALGLNTYSKGAIKLFPNPTHSILHLSVNKGTSVEKVTIVDITGKVVVKQTKNLSTINVEQLAKGVYILTAYAGDKKYQEKFIKE